MVYQNVQQRIIIVILQACISKMLAHLYHLCIVAHAMTHISYMGDCFEEILSYTKHYSCAPVIERI